MTISTITIPPVTTTDRSVTNRSRRSRANKPIELPDRQKVGQYGEDLAARFLEDRGAKIIGRNVTVKGGEIDIVAEMDRVKTVIEVRTVWSEPGPLSAAPLDAIDDPKLKLVRRHAFRLGGVSRIDLIGIRLWSRGADIHWVTKI